MPRGSCTVTQIRHWTLKLGSQWTKSTVANWRDNCSRDNADADSHSIRNRNLYMHCVLAVYTNLTSDAIAKRLNQVLGLGLCPDVVEYAYRKLKWNGMLERVRTKGPAHKWIMQSMDRLFLMEPSTGNSWRSANKTRNHRHIPGRRSKPGKTTNPRKASLRKTPRRRRKPLSRGQRRAQARIHSAWSHNFTTRRWARKPMWVWLWIIQCRCRVKYLPNGAWQWENPTRRNIWHYKRAYEKVLSDSSSSSGKLSTDSVGGAAVEGPLKEREMSISALGADSVTGLTQEADAMGI
ncbi:MAG: hypothetical protein M1813_009821 [Trichoglossum hirsutum]|nr:MAG: hypothetical protein M1813_009821 [Trichoglossum hirsutum]